MIVEVHLYDNTIKSRNSRHVDTLAYFQVEIIRVISNHYYLAYITVHTRSISGTFSHRGVVCAMNPEKVLRHIVQGKKGIRFSDFIRLIEAFGFTLDRVSGSHHIFKREGIEEMVNIQDYKGEAKPYQIRQFLEIIEKYGLSLEERE